MAPDPPPKPTPDRETRQMHLPCSFCGKSSEDTNGTIAGPQVYICTECVISCLHIFIEKGKLTVNEIISEVHSAHNSKLGIVE